jgi:hypothetical protein
MPDERIIMFEAVFFIYKFYYRVFSKEIENQCL